MDVFGFALEKHITPFFSVSGLGFGGSGHMHSLLLRRCLGTGPIHTSLAWHAGPPWTNRQKRGSCARRQAPAFLEGCRLPARGAFVLQSSAWTAARGTPRPGELLPKPGGGRGLTLASASGGHAWRCKGRRGGGGGSVCEAHTARGHPQRERWSPKPDLKSMKNGSLGLVACSMFPGDGSFSTTVVSKRGAQ